MRKEPESHSVRDEPPEMFHSTKASKPQLYLETNRLDVSTFVVICISETGLSLIRHNSLYSSNVQKMKQLSQTHELYGLFYIDFSGENIYIHDHRSENVLFNFTAFW